MKLKFVSIDYYSYLIDLIFYPVIMQIRGQAFDRRCNIQLFRKRLSNKTLRDNAERYYGQWRFMVFD